MESLTIPSFLDSSIAQFGDRPFVREDETVLSYAEFGALSRRAAGHFQKQGVSRGDRVAVLLGTSIAHLATWMGLARIGAIAVPLNTRLTAPEIDVALGQVRPVRLVVDEANPGAGWNRDIPVDLARDVIRATPMCGASPVDALDVAAFIFTSGSSGRPKAVMQTHRSYVLTGQSFPSWVGLRETDRMLVALPLHHINAQAYSVMGAIGAGASLVLVPRFSVSRFWDDVRRWSVTQFNAVGAMVRMLAAQAPVADESNPLRLCYTALALPESEHRRFEERFGLRMMVGYGMSETPFGTIWPLNGPAPYESIGFLRQHPTLGEINTARVVAAGRDVPPGVAGELLLRNPAIMAGYFDAPFETQAAIQDGWLHTGDLVTRDEQGLFRFVGRQKEMIRRRGENIAPAEIEVVLAAHPAVREAAVIGIPSEWGEEDVKAFVVLDREVPVSELETWCVARLAAYKRPSSIEIREEFPRTESQRVAKHLLR